MAGLLWLLVVIVLAFWLLGLVANVAGGFIHLLLIVALVLIVINLLSGRRRVL